MSTNERQTETATTILHDASREELETALIDQGCLVAKLSQALRDRDAEITRLRSALVPFANTARSLVVRDALSFGDAPPDLTITRGFGVVKISPSAFALAKEVLS